MMLDTNFAATFLTLVDVQLLICVGSVIWRMDSLSKQPRSEVDSAYWLMADGQCPLQIEATYGLKK